MNSQREWKCTAVTVMHLTGLLSLLLHNDHSKNDIVVFVSADLKESLAFEKLHSHCTNKL